MHVFDAILESFSLHFNATIGHVPYLSDSTNVQVCIHTCIPRDTCTSKQNRKSVTVVAMLDFNYMYMDYSAAVRTTDTYRSPGSTCSTCLSLASYRKEASPRAMSSSSIGGARNDFCACGTSYIASLVPVWQVARAHAPGEVVVGQTPAPAAVEQVRYEEVVGRARTPLVVEARNAPAGEQWCC